MERRSEVRFEVDRPVRVTTLDCHATCWTGTIRNLSGRGMQLCVPQSIGVGTPLRVDAGDVMFLGEVCYCEPEGDGFRVGMTVEHTLSGLGELARLNRSLFGDSQNDRETPEPAVSTPPSLAPR
ncbi:MAG: PilZ domain-containing protein [Acidobacteriales bacterium]|nr:PilZ domain-containing protein [Terriglobales bacterium]